MTRYESCNLYTFADYEQTVFSLKRKTFGFFEQSFGPDCNGLVVVVSWDIFAVLVQY